MAIWYNKICREKPVWCITLLYVQWKTPDDGQRNCPKHVEFYSKNKFEKLVHQVGFVIRIRVYSILHPTMRSIFSSIVFLIMKNLPFSAVILLPCASNQQPTCKQLLIQYAAWLLRRKRWLLDVNLDRYNVIPCLKLLLPTVTPLTVVHTSLLSTAIPRRYKAVFWFP